MASSRGIDLDELYPIVEYDPTVTPKPPVWLVEGLWIRSRINGIFGAEKSGKSRFTDWCLAGALLGQPVLGMPTKDPGRILYLAGEESMVDVVWARMRKYAHLQGGEIPQGKLFVMEASGLHLEMGYYRDWLEAHLDNYDMLVIDPYRRVHNAQENSNTEMAALHNDFRRWVLKKDKTIAIIHHTGQFNPEFKAEKLERIAGWSRGATDLAAIVDAACYVDRTGINNMINVMRKGRFPEMGSLQFYDLGANPPGSMNPDDDLGFQLKTAALAHRP